MSPTIEPDLHCVLSLQVGFGEGERNAPRFNLCAVNNKASRSFVFFKKLSNFRPHIAFFSGLSKCSSSCSWPKKSSRSSEQIRDERLCMEPAITDGCKSSTKHDKKSQFNGALFQLKNCIESLKTFLEIVRNIRWFPMPIAS